MNIVRASENLGLFGLVQEQVDDDLRWSGLLKNLHTPSDLLKSLVTAEQELIERFDPEYEDEVPDPILSVLRSVSAHRSTDPEVLWGLLTLIAPMDKITTVEVLSNPNLPQKVVESELDRPYGLAADITVREWLEIFERRGCQIFAEVLRVRAEEVSGSLRSKSEEAGERRLAAAAARTVVESIE